MGCTKHVDFFKYCLSLCLLAFSDSTDRRQNDSALVWGIVIGLERLHGVFPGRALARIRICALAA